MCNITDMDGINLRDAFCFIIEVIFEQQRSIFNHSIIIQLLARVRKSKKKSGVPRKRQLSLLVYRLRLISLLILLLLLPDDDFHLKKIRQRRTTKYHAQNRGNLFLRLYQKWYENLRLLNKFMKDDIFASKYLGCKSRCVICTKRKLYLRINNNYFINYHMPSKRT